jgi:hypothetical protein
VFDGCEGVDGIKVEVFIEVEGSVIEAMFPSAIQWRMFRKSLPSFASKQWSVHAMSDG